MVKIFIDPGHGGADPGAVGNGLFEKNLTLKISKYIRTMLTAYENIQVKLSRESDQTVSLNQRTNMANAWGAEFLLSVHINSGGGTGFEDYIHPRNRQSSPSYQGVIHEEIVKQIDLKDRGKKQENFHMLRESNMPAMLTENGFIDNPNDASKLSQSSYIERIARGHVNGLVRALKLKKKPERLPNWDGLVFKKGQIGRIKILKRINLWRRDENKKLIFSRILNPGEVYPVYGFDNLYGGQYNVGDNHWITNIDGYIKYETPSKSFLANAVKFYAK
ncbi:N-acetylmuramoyl-L-alanine amidase [Bacillus sp. DTU_2020_1000418_1_SI_GHA_SEK_038]|uniref:N-acetylmuramoyl-L-alanine amidase family protein n=1 Tax=Bacillus sp. DTU_2020_1000418_1_SI_GHA_SEK_038 TaxID=3077585 RepID=UPI0028E613F0|nr:N-acetylmuramoyl-L-alanine amidase [Bacillus sp. DTU_2020_1000418_1_SI_GHA_SEK_038]WNS76953.1 N-acetylmuramoyl-L-alanine amidase [Bacillus sp. DTU_2020_1000418_1_SI_GHA_SEK_038]